MVSPEFNPSQMTWEELRAQFNPEGSVCRRAQMRMVEMLLFLDRVCKEHGIRYWLDSGNLIGAARNGQFIPWDDDMDVCMPREDALRFKRLMLRESPSDEFVLQCRETDKGFFASWMVLRDLKSEYVQDSNLHRARKYRGLQVDIFIYEEKFFIPARKFAIRWQTYLIDKPLKRFRCLFMAKLLAVPSHFILHRLMAPLFRLFATDSDMIVPIYGNACVPRRKEDVFPLSEIEFEGHMISAPHNVDSYLASEYGDWRQIPDSVKTHDVEIIFR